MKSEHKNFAEHCSTSGQDGGVGRYPLPPHITKRKTITNLKAKNNQNCQKSNCMEPDNQGVKKKRSFRPLGRAEMGNWEERMHRKAVARGPGNPTFV